MIDTQRDGWKTFPIGGVIPEGGTSAVYLTGDWRGGGKRPVLNLTACVHCLHCWISCPDSAIVIQSGKMVGFDYSHCKGCGICAGECPPLVKAIAMAPEEQFEATL
jgi:pyruvate ferredoxin oxidoreductase delta subunit